MREFENYGWLKVYGASENNLKKIDVQFPLDLWNFTAINCQASCIVNSVNQTGDV